MKHWIKAWLIFSVVLFGPVPAALAATPAAGVILMISGDVAVLANGEESTAQTGMELSAGTTLSSRGGTASVLLKSGRMAQLKPGDQLSLGEEANAPDASGLAGRLMATLRETTRAGKGPTVKGMVRGGEEIEAVYPFNSAVLAEDLRFAWEPVEGLTHVKVTIKSRKPKFRMVIPAEPDSSTILPRDKSLSEETTYYWSVTGKAMAGGHEYASKLRWFSILSPGRTENLNRDLNTVDAISGPDEKARHVLRANVFIGYQLYHEAIEELTACRQKYPDQTDIIPIVKGVYVKMKHLRAAEGMSKDAS